LEKKQLNQKELEIVNGGGDSWGDIKSKYLPANHGVHICKEDVRNHLEERVYVVDDSNEKVWCMGVVKQSSPVGNDIYHYIYVEEKANCVYRSKNSVECFEGSNYTVFLYR